MILTAAFKTILTLRLTHTSESTVTHWHWHLQVSTPSNIFAKFQVDMLKFKIFRYTTTDWCPFLKKSGEHKEVEKHTYRVIAVLSLKPSQNVSRVCRHTLKLRCSTWSCQWIGFLCVSSTPIHKPTVLHEKVLNKLSSHPRDIAKQRAGERQHCLSVQWTLSQLSRRLPPEIPFPVALFHGPLLSPKTFCWICSGGLY